MDEKKYLNGNLTKNIAFGLCWLPMIGWIIALFVFIVDKDTLDLEEKRDLVSIFACHVIGAIAGAVSVGFLGFAVEIVVLVRCIMAFLGKSFQVPGAYHIAKAIIK